MRRRLEEHQNDLEMPCVDRQCGDHQWYPPIKRIDRPFAYSSCCYAGGVVVVVVAVDAPMRFPLTGLPSAGNGTNLPFLICTYQPHWVGAALP